MSDNYDIDISTLNKRKKSRDKLKAFDDDVSIDSTSDSVASFLPSLSLKSTKKAEKKPKFKNKTIDYDPDEWFNELVMSDNIKIKKKKGKYNVFDISDGDVKKKKKKKDKEMIDYKKEFAPEAALYSSLLKDQQMFTDSLQKEYDAIKRAKSTSRGYSKTLTDLTQNITSARSLAMQLVDKQASLKKTAADLDMKQRKEATLNDIGSANMAEFGSSFLKEMINQKQAGLDMDNDGGVMNYTNDDEVFDVINDTLTDDIEFQERPSEVDAYLKYENSNVVVSVVIHNNDEKDFNFIAKDSDGNILDDYPLPTTSTITVNRSANIATDNYGQKYNIIWD